MSSSSSTAFADAEKSLQAFVNNGLSGYERLRNYDFGPADRHNVSLLSKYITHRVLFEYDVVQRILAQHPMQMVEKFVQEVFWRIYWKGWLEHRPTVWADFTTFDHSQTPQTPYQQAINGKTGIDCFDVWAAELQNTNYLHNHARMWFASIWVHTLKLPWELGADFFLRHLLDGDAASNTLSWRWVAGLHTRGKTYIARASNIAKFTKGRFPHTSPLSDTPDELDFQEHPPVGQLKPRPFAKPEGKTGLILTEDDLSAQHWLSAHDSFSNMATLLPKKTYESLGISESVVSFRESLLRETPADIHLFAPAAIAAWAQEHNLKRIVMAEPAVGLWDQAIADLENFLTQKSIELIQVRHWWDDCLYPHATHGFFRFKKAIPKALDLLRGNSEDFHQPDLFHA